ncbi:hypothetical protein FA95DRAFT_1540239 [Auriscalpium vulgare]|uniref:Uncharacterized protein n=1 Tax=Auriscalpium vulgare TaxID=40419 RepID=A0ACB8RW76_9AGAM|nr:hypothetical protein FA95DRAFT_1540239 [Auriscalpium vulgare]
MPSKGGIHNPFSPLDDGDDAMERHNLLSLKSPAESKLLGDEPDYDDPSARPPRSSFRSSVALIPTPGSLAKRPPRYEPFTLKIWAVWLGSALMVVIGVGLEVAVKISQEKNGFKVPHKNVLSFVSTNFLTSFFAVLFVIPLAYLAINFDWQLRAWQPYLILSKGNATAQESLLLDYIGMSKIMIVYNSVKFKHRLITTSMLVTLLTYLLQPLAGSVLSIRLLDMSQSNCILFIAARQSDNNVIPASSVDSILAIGLSPDIDDLSAFASSAGFAEASAFNNFTDPPFIYHGWTVAQFVFPTDAYLNGTMAINTTAMQTNVNCANPISLNMDTAVPDDFSITATSVEGCSLGPVTFNPTNSEQLYGVTAVPNCGSTPQNVSFEPVFFWYYQTRQNGQHDARGVFCLPRMQLFDVVAFAFLNNGSLTNVSVVDNYPASNNVTGPPLNSNIYNGLLFDNSSNPNVQARALSIKSGIPNAIFRSAAQSPGGLDAVFDDNNGFLSYTKQVYTQHLALAAKANYFVPVDRTVSAELTQLTPRLWFDPLPSHVLSGVLLLVGLSIMVIHAQHWRSRRQVYLTHSPGAIGTSIAQTARSGFGELLYPYDSLEDLETKLRALRFRLDQRTGAIVVDDSAILFSEPPPDVRDETMMALTGQRHRRIPSSEDLEEHSSLPYTPGSVVHREADA